MGNIYALFRSKHCLPPLLLLKYKHTVHRVMTLSDTQITSQEEQTHIHHKKRSYIIYEHTPPEVKLECRPGSRLTGHMSSSEFNLPVNINNIT